MKKIIYFVTALCVIFTVLLGICICRQNSHEWLFAFMLFVSLLCLCVLENRNARNLKNFAYKDGSTGLQNRSAYEEKVVELNKRLCKKKNIRFGVVVFDINGLKVVNDSFGHKIGDSYISESARLIKSVYDNAELYRFGGDEFVAIIKGSEMDRMEELAELFAQKIDEFNVGETHFPFKLSVACGSATYDKTVDFHFSDVFNRADDKMYKNKRRQKASPQF